MFLQKRSLYIACFIIIKWYNFVWVYYTGPARPRSVIIGGSSAQFWPEIIFLGVEFDSSNRVETNTESSSKVQISMPVSWLLLRLNDPGTWRLLHMDPSGWFRSRSSTVTSPSLSLRWWDFSLRLWDLEQPPPAVLLLLLGRGLSFMLLDLLTEASVVFLLTEACVPSFRLCDLPNTWSMWPLRCWATDRRGLRMEEMASGSPAQKHFLSLGLFFCDSERCRPTPLPGLDPANDLLLQRWRGGKCWVSKSRSSNSTESRLRVALLPEKHK